MNGMWNTRPITYIGAASLHLHLDIIIYGAIREHSRRRDDLFSTAVILLRDELYEHLVRDKPDFLFYADIEQIYVILSHHSIVYNILIRRHKLYCFLNYTCNNFVDTLPFYIYLYNFTVYHNYFSRMYGIYSHCIYIDLIYIYFDMPGDIYQKSK